MARYKKRPREKKPFQIKDPLSPEFRKITNKINRGDTEGALSDLDALSARSGLTDEHVALIASLTADSQFVLGRYYQAERYYRRALSRLEGKKRIRTWLRPALGEIKSLLKQVRTEEAIARATEVWNRALSAYSELEQELELTNDDIENKPVKINQRPIRPSVVLTRLGNVFLDEGYTDIAKQYYQQAVLSTPRGASRARQGMAKISLAEENDVAAEQYARESLLMGKFQVKTISAWPVLIAARSKQDKALLDEELYTSLELNQDGRVKARAVLEIVKTLRSYGDERWRQIATSWVTNESSVDEIIEVEFAKILLSDAKYDFLDEEQIGVAAFRILRNAQASPKEMVATSKDIVRTLCRRGEDPPVDMLADKVERKYGAQFKYEARHGMSLGAMMAGRIDLARSILTHQIAEVETGSKHWGKGVWALARMEAAQGNHTEAAASYLQMADDAKIPEPFRIQALMHWLSSVMEISGSQDDVESLLVQAEEKIGGVLDGVSDYDILLDVGRQLTLGDKRLAPIRDAVVAQACSGAWTAFLAEEEPSQALRILIRLTRRQFYDFGKAADVVTQWQTLSEEKREWLWTEDSRFWEYLALVVQSYINIGKRADGRDFATAILDHGNAPPAGRIFVGTTLANDRMNHGEIAAGLHHYQQLVNESPTHRWTAWAYYWLGLKAWKQNDIHQAALFGRKIRKCFSGNPSLLWHWKLDAAGLLLQHNLEPLQVPDVLLTIYDRNFLTRAKEGITLNLKKL